MYLFYGSKLIDLAIGRLDEEHKIIRSDAKLPFRVSN